MFAPKKITYAGAPKLVTRGVLRGCASPKLHHSVFLLGFHRHLEGVVPRQNRDLPLNQSNEE
jgi:hypothetical protein